MTTGEAYVLYLGTEAGLFVARVHGDGLEIINRLVEGNAVRDIAIHDRDPTDVFVGCGLRGWGLHYAEDVRESARLVGFDDRWVWGVTRHPQDPETVYVGTEPPMVYASRDGGTTFEPLEGVDELPSRSNWTFFHDPFNAGHVHGFAIHPDRPQRIFAGVEHGAVIHSSDGGQTWDESLVGADVHRVAVNPTNPDHVLVATGSGLAQSFDAGTEWQHTPDLRGSYLHTILFDNNAPETVYVYADTEESPLYRSTDAGRSWATVGNGLPASGPADALRNHPGDSDSLVYVGDTAEQSSQVFTSNDAGETWRRLEGTLPKVWRLEVVPADRFPSS